MIDLIFLQERIRAWQIVGDQTFRPLDFGDAFAGVRRDLAGRVEDVIVAAEQRLGEIDRIVHHDHPCQIVTVPDEVLGHGRAIAPGDSVTPRPAFLEMRGSDGENVALPLASGKTHGGVHRVIGRVRTAIHPDGALGGPGEVMDMDGDQVLRVAVAVFPHPDVGETEGVVGGMHAALVFRQRDERRVPTHGAQAVGVVDGQPSVIAQFGTGQPVREILVQSRGPNAREVHLGLRRQGLNKRSQL